MNNFSQNKKGDNLINRIRERHPEKFHKSDSKTLQKPSWLKVKAPTSAGFFETKKIVDENRVYTVCQEASCPNIGSCWSKKHATFMIMGSICTRACAFCNVSTGKPNELDFFEPARVANAVLKLNLKHVVITSVDRDDIKDDFGAAIWADTINQIHKHVPNCTVEVLTPDFKGHRPSLKKVFKANPEIFSHNIECVERISKQVRAQAVWKRSLEVLRFSVFNGLRTKTGMMLGLGETFEEVVETMKEIAEIGVRIFTIGQYLQPSKHNLPVDRYVSPEEFLELKKIGLDIGFSVVESGSLVRSSYHADEQARLAIDM